MSVIFILYICA